MKTFIFACLTAASLSSALAHATPATEDIYADILYEDIYEEPKIPSLCQNTLLTRELAKLTRFKVKLARSATIPLGRDHTVLFDEMKTVRSGNSVWEMNVDRGCILIVDRAPKQQSLVLTPSGPSYTARIVVADSAPSRAFEAAGNESFFIEGRERITLSLEGLGTVICSVGGKGPMQIDAGRILNGRRELILNWVHSQQSVFPGHLNGTITGGTLKNLLKRAGLETDIDQDSSCFYGASR